MGKIICFCLIIFGALALNAQSSADQVKEAIVKFENKNYDAAYAMFQTAVQNGYNAKKLYYYLAVCEYYKNGPNMLVEKYILRAIDKGDLRACEFYAVEYPRTIDGVHEYFYSRNLANQNTALMYFCQANIEAKQNQTDQTQFCFIRLDKALESGYVIPKKYIESNPIKKLDETQYSEILGKYNINSYQFDMEKFVELNINTWQQKGKFEKTDDYLERVNATSREIKIKQLAQEYIDRRGQAQYNFSTATNEYDADNEIFKITFDNGKNVYVPVSIEEAPLFDKNFRNLKFENAQFTLNQNKFELFHVEMVNPANSKTYIFDSQEALAFNSSELNLNFDEIAINLEDSKTIQKAEITEGVTTINIGKSDVDDNIPENSKVNPNKFALIIGNENYQKYQTGLQAEQNVAFAVRDALTFKEYCIKTLGVPAENVIFKANAGVVQMQQSLKQMNAIIKNMNGDAEIIVYYAGHGFPDELTKEPYLIPVDVSSSSLSMALPLNTLVSSLTEYSSKKVVIFLDACFTGGGREQGLLASRGVKIVPKAASLDGNLVIFSASSAEQSALPYNENRHGLFTYYLLKKLQETNGEVSLSELDMYLSKHVSIKSTLIHSREQNPKTYYSPAITGNWGNWKIN